MDSFSSILFSQTTIEEAESYVFNINLLDLCIVSQPPDLDKRRTCWYVFVRERPWESVRLLLWQVNLDHDM